VCYVEGGLAQTGESVSMLFQWELIILTMPMNGRFDGQFVSHEYFNVISFVNFNQRARLLIIDEIDFATDAV